MGVPWHWSIVQISHTSKLAAQEEDESCIAVHILGLWLFLLCMPAKLQVRVCEKQNC